MHLLYCQEEVHKPCTTQSSLSGWDSLLSHMRKKKNLSSKHTWSKIIQSPISLHFLKILFPIFILRNAQPLKNLLLLRPLGSKNFPIHAFKRLRIFLKGKSAAVKVLPGGVLRRLKPPNI